MTPHKYMDTVMLYRETRDNKMILTSVYETVD